MKSFVERFKEKQKKYDLTKECIDAEYYPQLVELKNDMTQRSFNRLVDKTIQDVITELEEKYENVSQIAREQVSEQENVLALNIVLTSYQDLFVIKGYKSYSLYLNKWISKSTEYGKKSYKVIPSDFKAEFEGIGISFRTEHYKYHRIVYIRFD